MQAYLIGRSEGSYGFERGVVSEWITAEMLQTDLLHHTRLRCSV